MANKCGQWSLLCANLNPSLSDFRNSFMPICDTEGIPVMIFPITAIILCSSVLILARHTLVDYPIAPDEPENIFVKPLNDTKFTIFRKSVTWLKARTICKQLGGRLAVFPTRKVAKQIINAIHEVSTVSRGSVEEEGPELKAYELGMDRRYWIGLSDLEEEGVWVWANTNDYHLNYNMWYPGQPDHLRTGRPEHCGILWNPGYHYEDLHSFNDQDCNDFNYFIYEDLGGPRPPSPNPITKAQEFRYTKWIETDASDEVSNSTATGRAFQSTKAKSAGKKTALKNLKKKKKKGNLKLTKSKLKSKSKPKSKQIPKKKFLKSTPRPTLKSTHKPKEPANTPTGNDRVTFQNSQSQNSETPDIISTTPASNNQSANLAGYTPLGEYIQNASNKTKVD